METGQEIIDYPFEEDLAAAKRIDQMSRESNSRSNSREAYHLRTVEELLAPLTDPESFQELVREEATLPEFRKAWLKP